MFGRVVGGLRPPPPPNEPASGPSAPPWPWRGGPSFCFFFFSPVALASAIILAMQDLLSCHHIFIFVHNPYHCGCRVESCCDLTWLRVTLHSAIVDYNLANIMILV